MNMELVSDEELTAWERSDGTYLNLFAARRLMATVRSLRRDAERPGLSLTPEIDAQLKLILRDALEEHQQLHDPEEFEIDALATQIEHLLLPSAAPPPHKPVTIPDDVEREDDTQELLEQEAEARTEQEKAAWRKEPRV